MIKNICIFTGTRADYGLLKNLIIKIKKSRSFKLNLIVTGSHLENRFGSTFKEILIDKIKINKKIKIDLNNDRPSGIINSMSISLNKFSKALNVIKPDLVILLGDRYEIFCAATAATLLKIPIAHLHGGESTEGAIDEVLRHAITKMSYYHFTAADEYKKNVIQLGENPKRVFKVGGLGVDGIKSFKLLKKKEHEKNLKIKVNFHPETNCILLPKNQINEILKSISKFKKVQFIFTMPNADTGNNQIFNEIKKFVNKNENCHFFISLGQKNFLSLMKYSCAMLGNSSSGLLEMPTFKKPTIDVGDRQKGRLKSGTIITVPFNNLKIEKAIIKIFDKNFLNKMKFTTNPYGNGGAVKKIIDILEKIKNKKIKNKKFYKV